MLIQLPNVQAGGAPVVGGSTAAEMGMDAISELQKALTAGYGTDVSTLTGGAALRVQSLEKTLLSTIQENKHFRLFNKFTKTNAIATVDEWTEQSGVGGFPGGSTNSETGAIAQTQGTYARRVGLVKYLMTQRQVSLVQTLQGAIADSEAVEQRNGALQLLTDAEYLSFEGDSTVNPLEFDGIYAQMKAGVAAGQVPAANIVDIRAAALNGIAPVNSAAATIAGFGNFGTPTDIFCSQGVQADFDTKLDPAFRVPLPDVGAGGLSLGAPVRGIRTSWGDIANQPDVFIREDLQLQPFEVLYPTIATANAAQTPANVAAAQSADAASLFANSDNSAGLYYYGVAGVNSSGGSPMFQVAAQQNVVAGNKVVLTITRSAGAQETGYIIYRSAKGGGNVIAGSGPAGWGSDYREVARIAVAGATTTWTDYNSDIAGTTKAYILNMSPGALAISWRQLLPMLKFQLYPTNSAIIPWAQLLFGYLRIGKRRHHSVIKNILPTAQVWRPYGVGT